MFYNIPVTGRMDHAIDRECVAYLHDMNVELDEALEPLLSRSVVCAALLTTDGRLAFVNCMGRSSEGVDTYERVRGKLWWMLWPEGRRLDMRSLFLRALTTGSSSLRCQCPTSNGEMVERDIVLKVLSSRDGGIAGVLCKWRCVGSEA